jgi:predicted DNA-binding transcriptional regulator YafY
VPFSPKLPTRSLEQLELEHVPRDTGEPTGSLVRTVSMLVLLLKSGSLDFDWYRRSFEMSERQFVRDLQHLRRIVSDLGIAISNRAEGRVRLVGFNGHNRLGEVSAARDEALRAVARALGAPAAVELGAPDDPDDRRDRFLIYALPRLQPEKRIADIFATLKAAHAAGARVTFRYTDGRGAETTPTVEPYRVLAHNGRYFLVGYDVAPRKGWRYFALDRIAGNLTRAGSFAPRPIPPAYTAGDAVGMLQRGATPIEVTVRLSPVVAVSTISRRWQQNQRIEHRRDGSVDITLTVNDIEEVVRWSLGFGGQARVIAPERAVAVAQRSVADLHASYAVQSDRALRNLWWAEQEERGRLT